MREAGEEALAKNSESAEAMVVLRRADQLKGERDELAQAVHRLKSALGNFATQEYYRDISGLEAMAKESGEPLSLWREKWDTVTLKLQLLENELKDIAGL